MFPAAAALALFAPVAAAHAMQLPYTLPVPFWLYAYGATGALLASFVMVGYFVKATPVGSHTRVVDLSRTSLVRALARPMVITASRIVSVVLLAFVIVTGLFGTAPSAFLVTCLRIIFALGFTYARSIVGDIYRIVNRGSRSANGRTCATVIVPRPHLVSRVARLLPGARLYMG
jgi:hypothetical protein